MPPTSLRSEKAKESLPDEEVESLSERMKTGTLTLEDFLSQYQRVRRMGPINQIIGLVPGLSQIKNRLNLDDIDDKFFDHAEAIIYSMTGDERKHPGVVDGSRRRRVARGSGTTTQDVNMLLKQFAQMKKMMKRFVGGQGGIPMPSGMPGDGLTATATRRRSRTRSKAKKKDRKRRRKRK